MEELMQNIEQLTTSIMRNEGENIADRAVQLIKQYLEMLPVIISCYEDDRMENLREEVVFWPAQGERIVEAFKNNDVFFLADVLYNETYISLRDFIGELRKRGIDYAK